MESRGLQLSTDGPNIPKYGVADAVEAEAVERGAHLDWDAQEQRGFSENRIGRFAPHIHGGEDYSDAKYSSHKTYENWRWNAPPV